MYVNEDSGEVLITTQGAVNSGTGLYGIKGYLKGEKELNLICEKLYSNTSLETLARSMTIEDLNKACNYTYKNTLLRYAFFPYATTLLDKEQLIEYPIGSNIYYQKVVHYKENAKFYKNDGISDDGKIVYMTQTFYYYRPSQIVSNILGSNKGFLASTCIALYNSEDNVGANFRMRYAYSDDVSADYLCGSGGGEDKLEYGVRPLVTLDSSQIKLTGIGDGTSGSPYEIEKK